MQIPTPTSSYKLIAISVICIGAIAAISIFVNGDDGLKKESLDAFPTIKSIQEKDTDEDGLPDWEEAMWKTDPQNKDTDADGVYDGVEIVLGNNPLIAGAGATSTGADKLEFDADLTATDKVARTALFEILQLKRSGVTIDEKTKLEILQNAIDVVGSASSSQTITAADLKITKDVSALTFRNYGNSFAQIITTSLPSSSIQGNAILKQALQSQDKAYLKPFLPMIDGYKKMHSSLLAISVPTDFADTHIAYVNAVSKMTGHLEAIYNLLEDPVGGMQALEQYTETSNQLLSAFDAIRIKLAAKGVVFQQGEAGLIWQ